MAAPSTELPPLNDVQKEVARKFKVTEEEYARNVLAGAYGRERIRKRAQELGEAVQAVVASIDPRYRVIAVIRDMDRLGWVVRVETPSKDVSIVVSQELVDDLMESGSVRERERLRSRVLSSLEESKLALSR
jgi:hypothetical protein